MNREQIIRIAHESALDVYGLGKDYGKFADALERFAALVAAHENEACAKVCDDFERAKWESVKHISENGGRLAFAGPMHCAKAIRARGEATLRGQA